LHRGFGKEGREEIKTSVKALQLGKCTNWINAEIVGMLFNAEMVDMQPCGDTSGQILVVKGPLRSLKFASSDMNSA
jgi:hypothetical protein